MQGSHPVWVPHPDLGSAMAYVSQALDGDCVLATLVRNQISEAETSLRVKAADVKPVHPSCLEGFPDLLSLGEFNLGPLLHNIRIRYFKNEIYTSIGPAILISVNPYRDLPKLYSAQTASKYRQQHDNVPPHPFALAQKALNELGRGGLDQSIIISGESGAGKTEATKIILSYLAGETEKKRRAFHTQSTPPDQTSVEMQVTRSNPVLESFGNAKTVRNDNSSRFGKFLQVFFFNSAVVGGSISSYLLEKSRIATQQEDERNYHIFYQLCRGWHALDPALRLDRPEAFRYLRGCVEVDGRDDAKDFVEVADALREMGFTAEQMNGLWRLLAGILHLGNVEFSQSGGEAPVTIAEADAFETAAALLDVPVGELLNLLTVTPIFDALASKDIVKAKTREQAVSSRDALSKAVYEKIFQWLIYKINALVRVRGKEARLRSVGLLDIFGFETFETNSFEQLCINFANEELQQFFNAHIFREEQALYTSEGIDWSDIQFRDNREILDALTHRVTGVFPHLDSECLVPGGTDSTFLRKIIAQADQTPVIEKPPSLRPNEFFKVCHYAGPVSYQVVGMLDKNRDRVQRDTYRTFSNYGLPLLQEAFSLDRKSDDNNSGRSSNQTGNFAQATVSNTFRQQLGGLMQVLGRTNASYLRCIKPNATKSAASFDSVIVVHQLKCAGMLESIRIRKAGYETRYLHAQFLGKYRMLMDSAFNRRVSEAVQMSNESAMRELCRQLLRHIESSGEKQRWQIGRTKVFLKESMDVLAERLKTQTVSRHATVIAKHWRGRHQRRWYQRVRACCVELQARCRNKLCRQALYSVIEKRRNGAARKIQRCWLTYRKKKPDRRIEQRPPLVEERHQIDDVMVADGDDAVAVESPASRAVAPGSRRACWEEERRDARSVGCACQLNESLQQALENSTKVVEQQRKEFEELRKKMEGMERKNRMAEQSFKKRLDQKSLIIEQKDSEISKLVTEFAHLERVQCKAASSSEKAGLAIASLKNNSTEMLAALRQQLDQKDEENRSLQRQLEELDRSISSLETSLEEETKKNARLEELNKGKKKKSQRYDFSKVSDGGDQAEIKELKKINAQLQKDLHEVKQRALLKENKTSSSTSDRKTNGSYSSAQLDSTSSEGTEDESPATHRRSSARHAPPFVIAEHCRTSRQSRRTVDLLYSGSLAHSGSSVRESSPRYSSSRQRSPRFSRRPSNRTSCTLSCSNTLYERDVCSHGLPRLLPRCPCYSPAPLSYTYAIDPSCHYANEDFPPLIASPRF